MSGTSDAPSRPIHTRFNSQSSVRSLLTASIVESTNGTSNGTGTGNGACPALPNLLTTASIGGNADSVSISALNGQLEARSVAGRGMVHTTYGSTSSLVSLAHTMEQTSAVNSVKVHGQGHSKAAASLGGLSQLNAGGATSQLGLPHGVPSHHVRSSSGQHLARAIQPISVGSSSCLSDSSVVHRVSVVSHLSNVSADSVTEDDRNEWRSPPESPTHQILAPRGTLARRISLSFPGQRIPDIDGVEKHSKNRNSIENPADTIAQNQDSAATPKSKRIIRPFVPSKLMPSLKLSIEESRRGSDSRNNLTPHLFEPSVDVGFCIFFALYVSFQMKIIITSIF